MSPELIFAAMEFTVWFDTVNIVSNNTSQIFFISRTALTMWLADIPNISSKAAGGPKHTGWVKKNLNFFKFIFSKTIKNEA